MPPIVPRKRLRNNPPNKCNGTPKDDGSKNSSRKPTLYDDLDASTTPSYKDENSIFKDGDASDEVSSLSSLSDAEFEEVPAPKRLKTKDVGPDGSDDDDDDEMDFEDVAAPITMASDGPKPSGDLELTLEQDNRMSLINIYGDKKGPSKREKKARHATHCLHVMTLLWHNAVRNAWACDDEVQAIMLSQLPPKVWDEYDRWKRSSGLGDAVEESSLQVSSKTKSKKKKKGGPTRKEGSQQEKQREPRDWGEKAQKLEEGAVDMSHGDPLFRFMQYLAAWWKQRYKVTQPGLRKRGYMALERLDRITKAHKESPENPDIFGERVQDKEVFRKCAKRCSGSRDVGAQLFAALLRGLGFDARLVVNLQTLGFGFTKFEIAEPENQAEHAKVEKHAGEKAASKPTPVKSSLKPARKSNSKAKTQTKPKDGDLVVIDGADLDREFKDTDDESVVELESSPRRARKAAKRFDPDLEVPHYWVEVLSPVTKRYLPIDATVKGVVATNRDLVESFGPRGAKADAARQIMAYIVAYSKDGTAKDVTVRYLLKQRWPGRTKGARLPPEKLPVYNKYGKVKKHEMFDWFQTVMKGYRRGTKLLPTTEADSIEDSTDLKPAVPEKKEVKEGEETLQYYKQSKEFALQRHLRREEALKPQAKPVKVFKNKVKGGKVEEEDVFLRADVLNVKSAETWHKQGRAPLRDALPLKKVPYRAATTNRRREILEAERATGEKVLQGLFSWDQTEWIIPPPIKDGVIPKNDYGNIDLFAEHMCPEGAVHVPFRGAIKVCKRLGIDYAEAVVDFEFGHRMAVPVIRGVVVAEEYHDQVMEELKKDEAERERKEDEKRRKGALGRWRKFLMGLRIVHQIRQEYGEFDNKTSVFAHSKDREVPVAHEPAAGGEEADGGGGFLPEGYEEDEDEQEASSFFPVGGEEDEGEDVEDNLVVEDDRQGMKKAQMPSTGASSELSDAPSESPTPQPRRRADSDFDPGES